MTFRLILFFFGSYSVFRILCENYQQSFPLNKHMTKIGTTFFLLIFACSFVGNISFLFRSTTAFALILMLFIIPELSKLVTELQMEKLLPYILAQILFQMRLGKSFRTSFLEFIDLESIPHRKKITKSIYENVVFLQQKNRVFRSQLLINSISELQNINKTSHSAQKMLENLYHTVKINEEFRRRSGKVLSRLRVQSLIIAVLFTISVAFSLKFFGSFWVHNYLLPSAALMIIGIFWTFLMGRKISWTL